MCIGALLYLVMAVLHLALTKRPIGVALSLSWKLALATVVGVPLLGFGSILLAALVFNGQLAKMPQYSKVRDIIAAFAIATVGSVCLYVIAFGMAWQVFD